MRAPHFVRLAEIDDHRFVTACRHGLVHLTWGRTTTRFSRDEFRRLVALLEQSAEAPHPASLRDGNLGVTCRLDDECELRMGELVLLLSSVEYHEMLRAGRRAVDRLDEVLASGMWDRQEPDEPPPNPLERLGRGSFSEN